MTGLYTTQKNHDDYDWDSVDNDGKNVVALSGRSVNKYFASSMDGYTSTLEPVDQYDFIAEPLARVFR